LMAIVAAPTARTMIHPWLIGATGR
jgi:hypothetical protein